MSKTTEIGRNHPFVVRHAQDIAELPEPPEEWRSREFFDPYDPLFRKLVNSACVVEARETPRVEGNVWVLKGEVYETAVSRVEGGLKGPMNPCCGGSGFRNLGGCFECKRCGDTFEEFDE